MWLQMALADVATTSYCGYMKRATVLRIRLTPEESAELDRLRGDGTASAYVRRVLFNTQTVHMKTTPGVRRSDEIVDRPAPVIGPLTREAPKVVKGKTCEHGVERGFRCWQCGGPAFAVS